MASVMRYRGGEVRPMIFQTAPLVNGVQLYPIEVGDLVGLATVVYGGVSYLCAIPANAAFASGHTSITPVGGNAVTTGQIFTSAANFLKAFAGVALHKTGLQSGETTARLTGSIDPGYTMVATAGEFEFDCASTTWKPGDLAKVYNGAGYSNQQVVSGGISSTDAIGVAKPGYNQLGNAATSIIVSIRSTEAHTQILSGQ